MKRLYGVVGGEEDGDAEIINAKLGGHQGGTGRPASAATHPKAAPQVPQP